MIHVVLYEPEIPANTGNIIRTCMAAGAMLHLIEPLGFSFESKYLRRSSMDYIWETDIEIHPDWESFLACYPDANLYFMTRYGKKAPSQFDFSDPSQDFFLVLGKESTGIAKEILKDHLDRCMRLPMMPSARSLNLSNCAAILVYEVLRQQGYPNLSPVEYLKGEDFLETYPDWNQNI